ncbi:glycerophosphodiester phosphodiesterase family protein [Pedobacter nototheniae]|uniref:glycerophosphodiester phosphodiesterase family protein n=1 Tax=Pedobacter nototheniae TaxID=2488994 RepID=UPI0013F45509|nr:glycerophosphodiester phosphodiesterase family protein [Pedobacter nototheniae]
MKSQSQIVFSRKEIWRNKKQKCLVPFLWSLFLFTTITSLSFNGYAQVRIRPTLDQLRKVLLDSKYNPNYVLLALHRASWTDGTPENSIEAVTAAIANPNVEIIEVDVKVSKDGELYLMHDDYLQRTTNFLDAYPNQYGTGTDSYGKFNNYNWSDIAKLRLKNEEKIYTLSKIPLLEDIIAFVGRLKNVIIQLDINDDVTFNACIELVRATNSFKYVMFKGNKTVNGFTSSLNKLTEAQKAEIIFAPIIKSDSKPDNATAPDPMGFYNQWEAWCKLNPKYVGVAGIYQMAFKTSADVVLIKVAEKIRADGKKRVGIFAAQPEYYKGRYIGNVNINQCCAAKPEDDRRGDWDFILSPNGSKTAGINGYIITDEVITFLEFFPDRTIK